VQPDREHDVGCSTHVSLNYTRFPVLELSQFCFIPSLSSAWPCCFRYYYIAIVCQAANLRLSSSMCQQPEPPSYNRVAYVVVNRMTSKRLMPPSKVLSNENSVYPKIQKAKSKNEKATDRRVSYSHPRRCYTMPEKNQALKMPSKSQNAAKETKVG
jgi:hypothetical protein